MYDGARLHSGVYIVIDGLHRSHIGPKSWTNMKRTTNADVGQ